jgi:hypothetical protein
VSADQKPSAEIDAGRLTLPQNAGHAYREFGVMLDRREEGLGITFVDTARDVYRALDMAAKLPNAHVFYRQVQCSPWIGPVIDTRVTPPEVGSQ